MNASTSWRKPWLRHGHWVMPIGMLEDVAVRGRVRFALAQAFLVVFSDRVVAMQGFGQAGWARPLARTLGTDLDADPAAIVRRAGDAWLTSEEAGSRHRAQRTDAASQALIERLRDLLVAVDAGGAAAIEARLGIRPGDHGDVRVVGIPSPAIRAFLLGAARHAVRRADRSLGWRLRGSYPFLHLASTWRLVPATYRVHAPLDPAFATLRALRKGRAISRAVDWLAMTEAPAGLVAAARLLDHTRPGR